MADADLLDLIRQIGEAMDRSSIGADNDIAECLGRWVNAAQSGACGRRVGHRAHDNHALRAELSVRRIAGSNDPDARSGDMSATDEFRHDPVDDIDGNGKANSRIRA